MNLQSIFDLDVYLSIIQMFISNVSTTLPN